MKYYVTNLTGYIYIYESYQKNVIDKGNDGNYLSYLEGGISLKFMKTNYSVCAMTVFLK